MALIQGRNGTRGSVGLDVDGGYLAAVQLQGGQVAKAVSTDLADGVVRDGEVADRDALSAALKDFFKRERLPRNVRLGVSNQQIVVRHMELPRIEDPDDLRSAVRFQAQEAIPMPLDEVVLDHQVVGVSSGEGGPKLRLVVVAARQSMVQELVDAARGAGLRPQGIDLDAFALVRTLSKPSPLDNDATVYCHLAGVANLAIAVGTNCLFSRSLSVAPSAEELSGALADEVRLSIDNYLTLPDAPPVSGVLLSGPGAEREGLSDELAGLLSIPVDVAAPLGSHGSVGASEDAHRHTVATGLALGAAA